MDNEGGFVRQRPSKRGEPTYGTKAHRTWVQEDTLAQLKRHHRDWVDAR
jgi:hypothetical protein